MNRSLLLISASILLASCGSGGGSGSSTVSTITTSKPIPTTPAAPPTPSEDTQLYTYDPPTSTPLKEHFFNEVGMEMWNLPNEGGSRRLESNILTIIDEVNPNVVGRTFNLDRDVDVTYYDQHGFFGLYSHNGQHGSFISDVTLDLTIYSSGEYISDLTIGAENPIEVPGMVLGRLRNGYLDINSKGFFRDSISFDNVSSTGVITGAFSNQDTVNGNPQLVAGEVKVWYGRSDQNGVIGTFAAEPEE